MLQGLRSSHAAEERRRAKLRQNQQQQQHGPVTVYKSSVVRGPFYFVAFVFMATSCPLVFIALFTNNWQRTVNYATSDEFTTNGLWFTCRQMRINWPSMITTGGYSNTYCSTVDYSTVSWIYSVHVFYTIGAALILAASIVSTVGICRDFAVNRLGVPSMLIWLLVCSVVCQIVAVSVFGGKGIANYSVYEPDYSFIIACLGIGFSFFTFVMFIVEMVTFPSYQAKR